MENKRTLQDIANEVLKNYEPPNLDGVSRDEAGYINFSSNLARAFPLFGVLCKAGNHHAHLNPYVNGKNNQLKTLNSQETNTLKQAYTFGTAKILLTRLNQFVLGADTFEMDTEDNGFLTQVRDYLCEPDYLQRTLEDLALNQSKSQIPQIANIHSDLRKGFYWQNLPQEIKRAGETIGELISSRREGSLDTYLAENPDKFRDYFSALVSIANQGTDLFKRINRGEGDLKRFPLLIPASERELKKGDYVQGDFWTPEKGWQFYDGQVNSLSQNTNDNHYDIDLINASNLGNGTGTRTINGLISHTEKLNWQKLWRLGEEQDD